MTDGHRHEDSDSAAWQALEDWLGQDEEGRSILTQLSTDPEAGRRALAKRLQRSDAPSGVFNWVSDGTIDKLVNIARAEHVTVLASWIDRYWKAPAVGAAAAFLAAVTIGMAPIATYNGISGGSPLPIFQSALIAFYLFQRVPLNVHLSGYAFGLPVFQVYQGSGRIVFTLLGGWLLTGGAVCLGGYMAARLQGGSERDRVLAGARVAPPFAILACAASFIPIGTGNAALGAKAGWGVAPSHVGAFFFPMVWGLGFGLIGASFQVYGRKWFREALALLERRFRGWSSPVRAALLGISFGWALLLVVLVVTMIVGAVQGGISTADLGLKPGPSSLDSAIAFLLSVVLTLPHVLALAFLGAMGVSINWTTVTGLDLGSDSLTGSISIFGGTAGFSVPKYLLLLLLVAALAALATGYLAARGAQHDARAAVRAGFRAALPFSLTCWILAFLSGGKYILEGSMLFSEKNTLTGGFGPSGVAVFFLSIIWGLFGGWLGALLYVRRSGLLQQQS